MTIEFIKRLLSSILLILISGYIIIKSFYLFNFFLIILLILSLIEWHKMTFNRIYYLPGLIFLFFSFYTVYLFFSTDIKNSNFILILLICISTDIGGYIFGKIIKGPKLTKISPNKTYSGVIGSFFLPIIIVYFYFNYFNFEINLFLNLNLFFKVLTISLISQIGDLIVSYFKRLSNLKDSGSIIPGHGGILDRLDGMIFVFPIIYISGFF